MSACPSFSSDAKMEQERDRIPGDRAAPLFDRGAEGRRGKKKRPRFSVFGQSVARRAVNPSGKKKDRVTSWLHPHALLR